MIKGHLSRSEMMEILEQLRLASIRCTAIGATEYHRKNGWEWTVRMRFDVAYEMREMIAEQYADQKASEIDIDGMMFRGMPVVVDRSMRAPFLLCPPDPVRIGDYLGLNVRPLLKG